jgi:hypothetical protein
MKSKPTAISFLLKWVEGGYIVGPSLGCFVIAMINKKTLKMVKTMYGVKDFKEFEKLNAK